MALRIPGRGEIPLKKTNLDKTMASSTPSALAGVHGIMFHHIAMVCNYREANDMKWVWMPAVRERERGGGIVAVTSCSVWIKVG